MTATEIETIASVFIKEGIKKIRLTGGEPLVRKDAKEIIQRLSKYPVELAITTNGVFVHDFIETFKQAGLRSVNVSLDSLRKEKNREITQRDEFDKIYSNINLLLENDFHVKINVVVMKNVNDDEILDFVEWTKKFPVHVRFIEFMPFSGNQWSNEKNDTAKKYFVPEHKGTFAVISTMSEPFCSGCNRLRLTTDGKMKNCLFSKGEVDILDALRNNKEILPLIKQCVADKAESLGGQFTAEYDETDASQIENRSMINIGG
jgi:cyclic pyranopterin phosphate synthase